MMLVPIGDDLYSLYRDYDRGKYHKLDLVGRVHYMRARVERDLLHPCRVALKCADRLHVGLIVGTSICAGIAAAGTFLIGGRAPARQDGQAFGSFVSKYMSPTLQAEVVAPRDAETYAKWLYRDVRNGLAHAFSIERGGIDRTGEYVRIGSSGEPEINIENLLDDFAEGWNMMLDEVVDNPESELAANFVARFNQIFRD